MEGNVCTASIRATGKQGPLRSTTNRCSWFRLLCIYLIRYYQQAPGLKRYAENWNSINWLREPRLPRFIGEVTDRITTADKEYWEEVWTTPSQAWGCLRSLTRSPWWSAHLGVSPRILRPWPTAVIDSTERSEVNCSGAQPANFSWVGRWIRKRYPTSVKNVALSCALCAPWQTVMIVKSFAIVYHVLMPKPMGLPHLRSFGRPTHAKLKAAMWKTIFALRAGILREAKSDATDVSSFCALLAIVFEPVSVPCATITIATHAFDQNVQISVVVWAAIAVSKAIPGYAKCANQWIAWSTADQPSPPKSLDISVIKPSNKFFPLALML